MSYFAQSAYDIRFEWGLAGLQLLAPQSDAVIVVDVLSFSTCVDILVANGGLVFPYRGEREALPAFAAAKQAEYARHGRDPGPGYSLSPAALQGTPPGLRLVLPSPNGSTLSLSTGQTATFTGCLRNAQSVAAAAARCGPRISVIAAGERWGDGRLRPALEDLIGAGAIIHHLPGTASPEANAARALFNQVQSELPKNLETCGSGRELNGRGFSRDVTIAAQLNVSSAAPLLVDGAYRQSPAA